VARAGVKGKVKQMLNTFNRRVAWMLSCLTLHMLVGLAQADPPARPPAQTLPGHIQLFQVTAPGASPGQQMKIWTYLPPGDHPAKSLPCIFMAPSGSNLITGKHLVLGDRVEHLPYANVGFAVVAYELDGDWTDKNSLTLYISIRQFMASHGGLDNAHTAIEFALTRFPEIDPARLYAVGHSSAGTMALDLAAADPRIKACCAYAPAPDVRQRYKSQTIVDISLRIPGFAEFIDSVSPSRHIDALKSKPVLLFTAADDRNVPTQSVRDFAAELEHAEDTKVKLVTTEHGGHVQSMFDRGIPAGIAFLEGLEAEAGK
jgi:dipeptidyl aminopeptidase/acylaminoacyl peptidase